MVAPIDMYSPCPCGSGKKVKFCCRELVQEFQRLIQMQRGGQRQACLDRVERLLKKHPDNAFLRTLQIELHYALERYDRGDELIQQWVKQEPDNPVPLGWSAVSLVAQAVEEEDVQERQKLFRMAVRWLQRALEQSPQEVPLEVARAMDLVAKAASQEKWFLPWVGHARLFNRLEVADRGKLADEVLELTSNEHVPLVVRRLLFHPPSPEKDDPLESEWKTFFQRFDQGQYQQAEELLAQLVQQHPEHDLLWYYLGVVRSFLAEDRRAVEALERAAEVASWPWRRIEALALGLIVRGLYQEGLQQVGVEIPVEDAEQMLEALQGLSQLKPSPPFPHGLDLTQVNQDAEEAAHQSVPPPRAVFRLVDPELPLSNGQDGPYWGTVLLYGKETDRPARVQLFGYRWSEQDAPLGWEELVRQVPELQWEGHELVVLEELPFYFWFARLPDKQPRITASEKEQWLRHRLRQWSRIHRLPQLDHQTLAQAAEDPQKHPLLQAVLLLLETQEGDPSFLDVDLDQFRQELGLEIPEPIPVADPEELDRISPCWYHRLETRSFTVEMWTTALNRVLEIQHRRAQRMLAQACYEAEAWKQRPGLASQVAMGLLFTATDREESPRKILSLYQDARRSPEFDEAICASWDSLLLPLYMQRGPNHFLEVVELAKHVLEAHPGNESLHQLAFRYLEIIQAVQLAQLEQGVQAAKEPQEAPSGLWTPDQGPPQAPAAGPQKLWTPD